MLWSHVCPIMTLKLDKSSTTENHTSCVTRSAWTGNTMSPKEVVEATLNPDSICMGFSRADGGNPIYLYVDIYKRSTELPGLTKTCLTSKLLIPNVKIRASSCNCNTWLGSIGEKVIILSTGPVPPFSKPHLMELTCSLTEATRGLSEYSWSQLLGLLKS